MSSRTVAFLVCCAHPQTTNYKLQTTTIIQSGRGSIFNGEKPPLHSGELNHALTPSGWPYPIPTIPANVVRTPHLCGAPTTEETSCSSDTDAGNEIWKKKRAPSNGSFPNSPSTEAQKSKFSQREIVIFTTGTVRRFLSVFSVREKKKNEEIKNMKKRNKKKK